MSITVEHRPHEALLRLHGPVTQDALLTLRQHLEQARSYWQYSRVVLEINSPGGELLALRALATEIERWRKHGQFATTGYMSVASAAALALSLGDIGERSVECFTHLVYHHTRVMGAGESPLTARHADATAKQLSRADRMLLEDLVDHLVRGLGGERALGEAGLERCRRLQHSAEEIRCAMRNDAGLSASVSAGPGRKIATPKLLRRIESAYQRAQDHGQVGSFLDLLADLFAQDCRMPVDLAWTLLLIDKVEGVEALQHQPIATPVDDQSVKPLAVAPRMAA